MQEIDVSLNGSLRHSSSPKTAEQLLISVVIVCYNQARYLRDAAESALAQTYPNVEVLIVDDGSTDSTPEVARHIAHVGYFRQANLGLSAARNTGLRETHGSYIIFLDADDRLLPHAVECGVACFRRYPDSGFVFGGFKNIWSNGSRDLTHICSHNTKDHYWHFLRGNFVGMHATVMYPRNVLESIGGFNTELRACEDYEIFLRITRRWKIQQHSVLVAEYRQHDTNMSGDHVLMLRSALRVLEMEAERIHDPRHKHALQSGIVCWKRYYARVAITAWRKNPSARGFLIMARWHSRAIIERGLKAFYRRTRRFLKLDKVRFGSMRRLSPISRQFGFDRGRPIDRHYIESFLADFSTEIRGQVLEIGDKCYSETFGGTRITGQDVLHVAEGYPGTTIVADLEDAPNIPSARFDCIILTQTLHLIYDLHAALRTLFRILKPGGTLLVTLPSISQICRDPGYPDTDSWRFSTYSARRLFSEYFCEKDIYVQSYGNVLAATAFLYGLATRELTASELDHHDPDYPVIIGVRARKADDLQ